MIIRKIRTIRKEGLIPLHYYEDGYFLFGFIPLYIKREYN